MLACELRWRHLAMERWYHIECHCAANQTVIQLEKTLTDNTDAGAMPSRHDTTAHHKTYVIRQIFKQLHDKVSYLKKYSTILHRTSDGSYVINCDLDGYSSRVGNQTPGWFESHHATPAARSPDGAALVSAYRHIHFT